MPIDINLLREYKGGNPDLVRQSEDRRFCAAENLVDICLALDDTWRGLVGQADEMRKQRSRANKAVAVKKKAKQNADEEIAAMKAIAQQIPALEAQVAAAKEELDSNLRKIGNIVHDSVVVSNTEDDNEIVALWGDTTSTGEHYMHHHEVLWRIGGYEPERGVGVAGHRAYFLQGMGVRLNMALQAYAIQFLCDRGYTPLQPPYFMNKDVMGGVAQLEEYDEALYKVTGEHGDEKYLIATSEQPICGFHKGEWLTDRQLPKRYAGVSTCFRKEAGSHGKDTWGIFRVHQFEKIEQFVITSPEESWAEHEKMRALAEEFLQSMGIGYRVVNIVSAELNNAAAKKYDIEAWFPAYAEFRELVSCSNCTDYQSRSMETRYGQKKLGSRTKVYCHMLNSTLCATTRNICAILENFQTPSGVRVPEVLVPYMGGITLIPYVRELKVNVQAQRMKRAAQKKGKGGGGKKAQAAAAPAAAAAPTAATATAAPSEGKTSELDAKIAAQADAVRAIKGSGASKEAIKAEVEKLLALKREAGLIPAAGAAKQKKGKGGQKKQQQQGKKGKDQGAAQSQERKAAEAAYPAEVKAAADQVRALKDSGAGKDEIKAAVATLIAMKQKHGLVPPPKNKGGKQQQGKNKGKGGKQKQKGGNKKAAGAGETKSAAPPAPPAAATAAPAAPTFKPAPALTGAAGAAIARVSIGGNVAAPAGTPNIHTAAGVSALNTRVTTLSYLNGYTASSEDAAVYDALFHGPGSVDAATFPAAARWYRHIGSYSAQERAGWPTPTEVLMSGRRSLLFDLALPL